MKEGLKIDAWLWSSPDLKGWKRLLLFWAYIPILIYAFLKGTPTLLGGWEKEDKHHHYIDFRDLKNNTYQNNLVECSLCKKFFLKTRLHEIILTVKGKEFPQIHAYSCDTCDEPQR